MSKKIIIKELLEDKSERVHKLSCVLAKNSVEVKELEDIGCEDLKDYAVNVGGTCVIFYAREGGKEYLVKKIMYKYGQDRSLEISNAIVEFCGNNNYNYFLSLEYVATDDENNVYHVFKHVHGENPKYKKITNIEDLVKILKEYIEFLYSLDMLHKCGYTHFDVKPQNIFRVSIGGNGENIMQVIDFGSAQISSEVQQSIGVAGEEAFKYQYTEGWYTVNDIGKYCGEIHKTKEKVCVNVLDLTAAVRVLSYFMCSKDSLNFNDTWIGKLEGTCSMLREIEKKANDSIISKRYLSCGELIKDVNILIESLEGRVSTPKTMKIVSMNTRSTNNRNHLACYDKYLSDLRNEWLLNHPNSKANSLTIKRLKESINPNLLVKIYVNGKRGNVNFEKCSFNPIEDICLNNPEKNIILQGRPGGGKSTAIKKLYLDSLDLSRNANNILYLYLRGADFENSKNVDRPIIEILKERYHNCSVEKFVNSKYNVINRNGKRISLKTKVYVLLDALDEVPKECIPNICKEINELNQGGVFFLITSRNLKEYKINISSIDCVKNSDPDEDSFQPLTTEQVKSEVGMVKNQKISELIRTPMFMVIYKKILEQEKNKASINKIGIEDENDLLDEYFKIILNTSKIPSYVKKNFDTYILKYCCDDVSAEEIDSARDFIKDYRIEHVISYKEKNVIDEVNGSNDTRKAQYYTTVYSHGVYKDYFEKKKKS